MKHLDEDNILTDIIWLQSREVMHYQLGQFLLQSNRHHIRGRRFTDCMYLDLKKTFDEVLHKRLAWKLHNIGKLGRRNAMMDGKFLKGQSNEDSYKGKEIFMEERYKWSPQGVVLGLIVFAVYTNKYKRGGQLHEHVCR